MRIPFKEMVRIHKQVIHDGKEGHTDICTVFQGDPDRAGKPKFCPSCLTCKEEKIVNELSISTLSLICKDCFGETNEYNAVLEMGSPRVV